MSAWSKLLERDEWLRMLDRQMSDSERAVAQSCIGETGFFTLPIPDGPGGSVGTVEFTFTSDNGPELAKRFADGVANALTVMAFFGELDVVVVTAMPVRRFNGHSHSALHS